MKKKTHTPHDKGYKRSLSQLSLCDKQFVDKDYKNHPFWFFGYKHAERCDFYIETPNEIFAVKLFGVKNRRSTLVFMEGRRYCIRYSEAWGFYAIYGRRSARRLGSYAALPWEFHTKPKNLPLYDFRYHYKDEWEIKSPRNILLVNPVCMDFVNWANKSDLNIISAGEIIYGMEITSLPHLLRTLEDAL